MHDSPPLWLFARRLLSTVHCREVIEHLERDEGRHWEGQLNTFSNDTPVQRLFRDESSECISALFRKVEQMTAWTSCMLGVDIDIDWLDSIHATKWRPGDEYGKHHDCDLIKRDHLQDTKMSVYVSLQDGGGLTLDGDVFVGCNTGDAFAFNAFLDHSVRDVDRAADRYSLVAWILGPRWR